MRRITILILLLASVRAAHSQPDSIRWTRAAAQDRALRVSPELARGEAVLAEGSRLERVGHLYNPELSVEAEGAPAPWSSRGYTRRIAIEQELDLRGERRARGIVGRATREVAARHFDDRRQEVTATVDEIYSRLLVARRKAEFFEPLRQRARDLQGKLDRAQRQETVTGFDARLLQADALAIEADWRGAQREAEVAESELRAWLALPARAAFEVEDDLDQRPWPCNADSAWALALQHASGLARAAANESLALARVQLEQRLARGNPSFGASVGQERLELETAGSGLIQDEDTFVGVSFRIPLPLFAVNQPGINEARLELEKVRAERAAIEREVRQAIIRSCAALQGFEEQRRLRQDAAKAAASDLLLIEAAYEGGRIPLDEYLTLRERLVRQQERLMEVTGSVEEERSRLVRATGLRREDLTLRWSERP